MFVAEIGDVHRFTDPAHLCSWAGLTPRHRESDTVVHRGHLTKQGSKAVRWAAIEAVQRHPTTAKIAADKHRIQARRGTNIATVAAARKLLTLVYYGLRARPGRPPQSGVSTPGRNTRAAADLSDPPTLGVVARLIDPACCHRTTPCPHRWAKG